MPKKVEWFHCSFCDAAYRNISDAKACEDFPPPARYAAGDKVGMFYKPVGKFIPCVVTAVNLEQETHKPLYNLDPIPRAEFHFEKTEEYLLRPIEELTD